MRHCAELRGSQRAYSASAANAAAMPSAEGKAHPAPRQPTAADAGLPHARTPPGANAGEIKSPFSASLRNSERAGDDVCRSGGATHQ